MTGERIAELRALADKLDFVYGQLDEAKRVDAFGRADIACETVDAARAGLRETLDESERLRTVIEPFTGNLLAVDLVIAAVEYRIERAVEERDRTVAIPGQNVLQRLRTMRDRLAELGENEKPPASIS